DAAFSSALPHRPVVGRGSGGEASDPRALPNPERQRVRRARAPACRIVGAKFSPPEAGPQERTPFRHAPTDPRPLRDRARTTAATLPLPLVHTVVASTRGSRAARGRIP